MNSAPGATSRGVIHRPRFPNGQHSTLQKSSLGPCDAFRHVSLSLSIANARFHEGFLIMIDLQIRDIRDIIESWLCQPFVRSPKNLLEKYRNIVFAWQYLHELQACGRYTELVRRGFLKTQLGGYHLACGI